MEIRFSKWGGRRHWRCPAQLLGSDAHGTWLGIPAGVPMQRGDEPPITNPYDSVTLVPADGCWIATFNTPGKTRTQLYVDVTTRPVVDAEAVHAVDLDLDVIRLRDGKVKVLDEDEFADHQIRYAYPPEIIAQARATTADLVARIAVGAEPFGTAGPARLAGFRANGTRRRR